MATSVATLKYGNYTFTPVAQVGIRDATQRIGESKFGPGNIRRVVTLKGKLFGNNLNEVQTAVWALQAALALEGQTLYYKDGTTVRINDTAQVSSIDIPEDWGQFEADYTIQFEYIPLTDTHYAAASVSYNGYTFNPIPAMGRELVVNRDDADSITRQGATATVTLTGFIDKGSVSANFTEINALMTALASDGTLTFGSFVQSVRVDKISIPPDIGDRRLTYSVSFKYDAMLPVNGVRKMSSSRSIKNDYRVAIHYIPYQDDAIINQIGRNGSIITAQGYVIADSMVHAQTAANTEVNSLFPFGGIEQARTITEKASDNRIDWNVQQIYATPPITGGIYGGFPLF